MFACEISLIPLCFFKTIYAVLLLMVGRVVVHLCDHNYSYGRIGGLRQIIITLVCGLAVSSGQWAIGAGVLLLALALFAYMSTAGSEGMCFLAVE